MPFSTSNLQSCLRITLFGGLSIRQKDQPPVALPPQQSAALLAYLALNESHPQSREYLLGLFWPESEPEKARQNLRQCLHTLRDLLEKPPYSPGSILLTTRTSIQLNPQLVSTDVAEFERALESAHRSGDRAEQVQLLSRAAELYCGELLPGFYQDCFVLEQRRLAEQHLETLRLLTTNLEAVGDYKQALSYAHRAVLLDPLSEEAHSALMRLYAAMGQPASVQRQYLELEARLQKEFGEGTSEETRLLARRLQEAARRQAVSHTENEIPVAAPTSQGTSLSASEKRSDLLLAEENSFPTVAVPVRSLPGRWRRMAFVAAVAFVLLALFFWQTHHASPYSHPPAIPKATSDASAPQPVSAPSAGAQGPSVNPTHTALTGEPTSINKMAIHSPSAPPSSPRPIVANPEAGRLAGPQHVEKALTNGTGDVLWAAHYEPHPGYSAEGGSEPTAMTVDASGNIYITGFLRTRKTDVDYLTLKYSPAGKLLWQQRYNGPGNDLDRAKAIAVDIAGNVYVTGESDGGKGHGADTHSGLDIATIKYGPDGKPSRTWPDVGFGVGVRRYAGEADGMDSGHKIAVDLAGNVYVYGQSWNGDSKQGGTGFDLILIKYSPVGQKLWEQRYPSRTTGQDIATDMFVDHQGNAFLTGMVEQPNHVSEIITLKYDTDGNRMWKQVDAGQEHLGAAPTCIVRDRYDNVYVVGQEAFAVPKNIKKTLSPYEHGSAYLVLKYHATGEPMWRQEYRWPGYGYVQRPSAAASDGTSSLYVTGWARAEGDSPWCGTLDFEADGALAWHEPSRTAGHNGFYVRALGINSVGDVLLAGWGSYLDPIRPGEDTFELVALQYAPGDGKLKTRHRYATSPYNIRNAVLMGIDRNDNVIVCGHAYFGAFAVITTVKFRP